MKKSPYVAFTSPFYRILNGLCAVLFLTVGFLADVYIGSFGVVMLASVAPVILVFIDYLTFAGASTRKLKSMSYMKSSYNGASVFKGALKTDLILKEICLLFCFLGFFLAELLFFSGTEGIMNALALTLIYLPVGEITLMVALIISRRIAVSLIAQIAVCYICSMLSTFLMVLYSFLLPENLGDYMVVLFIVFAAGEAVSKLCAVLLYKDCVKGYESGFLDT